MTGSFATPRKGLCADARAGSLSNMRDETIGSFLTRLAARSATPGGGATGALQAAQAAGLLAMVARFSEGPRYDTETVGRIRAAADGLIDESVELAAADEAAFGQVAAAYRLPKDTAEAQAARSGAIADASAGAARPPADLMAAATAAGRAGRGTAPGGQQERDLGHRRRVGGHQRRRGDGRGEHRGEPARHQGRRAQGRADGHGGTGRRGSRPGRPVIEAVRQEITQ